MNPPHVLGKFRLPIVHVLTFIAFIFLWIGSGNFLQALIYGAIGWGVFWCLTTEVALKFTMSGVPAVILMFILYFITDKAFDGDHILEIAIPGVGLLAVWIWLYNKLDKSSWIGTPCPHCHVRGKTDKEEIHKEYLGQKTEKSGDKWVTYNLYNVTYRNWCNSCGIEWQTTEKEEDRA